MAFDKSLNGEEQPTLIKCITKLKNDKASKYSRISDYEALTSLIMKGSYQGDESFVSLHTTAIPITLQDLRTGNDTLVLQALGFLGGVLQVIKLPLETQVEVIQVLTDKLKNVNEKNKARKLMWSLANVQFDNTLPEASLLAMLNAACTFLNETPPVLSLSTVCESLNAVKNIGQRHKEFVEAHISTVLTSVFPWLFYEADRIRELSLNCLKDFQPLIANKKLLDVSFQNLLKEKYYNILIQLVSAEVPESLRIWSFLIESFGTQLHSSVALLNELLKVKENALKSKNAVFRQQALEHWVSIIDCFALNPSVLNNSKRIKLILVPLKSTDTRTEQFGLSKMKLWWHLLYRLGSNAAKRYQEVVATLLHFCFGGQPPTKSTVVQFPRTVIFAGSMLAGILSCDKQFKCERFPEIFRIHHFLEKEDFDKSADLLSQYCIFTLGLIGDEYSTTFEAIFQSFILRCHHDKNLDSLKKFMGLILDMIIKKPELMGVTLRSVSKMFPDDQLTQIILDNASVLFQWYIENEPLPTHPLTKFMAEFFEAGIEWNTNLFSERIMHSFDSFKSSANKPIIAELWSKFATTLLGKSDAISFASVNPKTLLLPLTWCQESLDESFLMPWDMLLVSWMKTDSSILEKILNLEKDLLLDGHVFRIVMKSLLLDIDLYYCQMSGWIKRWTLAWIKRAEIAENKEESINLLVDLILFMEAELKESTTQLLVDMKSSLELNPLPQLVVETLQSVFEPSLADLKPKNGAKIRLSTKICKIFKPVLPVSTPTRLKTRTKSLDDFVVIPPSQKKKRVLTDHQKEVMRSKRRSSTVPAMYNDLSQDSQGTQSMDTQSSEVLMPVVVSYSSISKEEDALLEPPSPMSISLPVAVVENVSPSLEQKDNSMDISSVEDVEKDLKLRSKVTVPVMKLRPRRNSNKLPSKLDSQSLDDSAASDQSLSSTSRKYQRPGPASKKRLLSSFSVSPLPVRDSPVLPNESQPVVADSGSTPEKDEGKKIESAVLPIKALTPRRVALESVDDLNSSSPKFQSAAEREEPAQVVAEVHSVAHSVNVTDDMDITTVGACDSDMVPLIVSTHSLSQEFTPNTDENQAQDMEIEQSYLHSELNAKEVGDLTIAKEAPVTEEEIPEAESLVPNSTEPSLDSKSEDLAPVEPEPVDEDVDTNSNILTASDNNPSLDNSLSAQTPAALGNEVFCRENIPPLNHDDQKVLKETAREVPDVNSLDIFAETTQPDVVKKMYPPKLLKTFTTRAKKKLTPTRHKGPSPSSGQFRGAQILELSRKIQNEPPNKKARKEDSPPSEKTTKNINNNLTVSLTPEGSPVRVETWVRHTYSPYASPSSGILKKRLQSDDGEDMAHHDGSPVSSTKSRRVSFADPEVSRSVTIQPTPKRLSRTRRSLITTYSKSISIPGVEVLDKDSSPETSNEIKEQGIKPLIDSEKEMCDSKTGSDSEVLPNESDGVSLLEEHEPMDIESSTSNLDAAQTEEKSEEKSFYPELMDCSDPLSDIVQSLTPVASIEEWLTSFTVLEVFTIGELCSLTSKALGQLPSESPPHQTLLSVLAKYVPSSSSKAETAATVPVVSVPKSATMEESSSELPSSLDIAIENNVVIEEDRSEEDKLEDKSDTNSSESITNGQVIRTPESSEELPLVEDVKMSDTASSCSDNIESCEVQCKVQCEAPSEVGGSSLLSNPIIPSVGKEISFQSSVEDVINFIEGHPNKDGIAMEILKRYMSITWNGKALSF